MNNWFVKAQVHECKLTDTCTQQPAKEFNKLQGAHYLVSPFQLDAPLNEVIPPLFGQWRLFPGNNGGDGALVEVE